MQTKHSPIHIYDHDIQMCRSVARALAAFEDRRFHQITVVSRDGVLTLTGVVASDGEKLQAEHEALAAIGATTLINELFVVQERESFWQRVNRIEWNREMLWRMAMRRDVIAVLMLLILLMPSVPYAQAWWQDVFASRVDARIVGQLIVRGKPAAHATIIVQPIEGSVVERYTAVTDHVGNFRLPLTIDEDLNPDGEFVASVLWFKPRLVHGEMTLGKNQVPLEYASASSSPLRFSIQPGDNLLPDFLVP